MATRTGLTSDQRAGGVLQEGRVADELTQPLVLGEQQLRATGRRQARYRHQRTGRVQAALPADSAAQTGLCQKIAISILCGPMLVLWVRIAAVL